MKCRHPATGQDRMRINDLLCAGLTELTAAGVPDCRSDVELLLGHCLGKSRTELFLAALEPVSPVDKEKFLTLLARRKRREPLAYILGDQEFWSLSFTVNSKVLIPRPETEFLLETVFSTLSSSALPQGQVMDLCCGSGVIAIILAKELQKNVTAIDFSEEALRVSLENCRRHEVENLVDLVRSDLCTGIAPQQRYSLVVSNPPYVSTTAILHEIEPEVGMYEPRLALDGGAKGMDVIQRIHYEIPKILVSGGMLFMEIGYDQGQLVHDLFSKVTSGKRRYTQVEVLKDYAGRDRVLRAKIS